MVETLMWYLDPPSSKDLWTQLLGALGAQSSAISPFRELPCTRPCPPRVVPTQSLTNAGWGWGHKGLATFSPAWEISDGPTYLQSFPA